MSLRKLKPDELIKLGDTAKMAQGPHGYARITSSWCASWVGHTVAEYARFAGVRADDCVRRMEPDAAPKTAWELKP